MLVRDYGAMIDRESPVPPYRQVAAVLEERIENGTYTRRLPSARDIQQEFGVAQLTARKALQVLVDEGAAELSPGMGYYVKDPG